jgi:hypothetical protein
METEKNDKAVSARIPQSTWEFLISVGGTAGGAINAILYEVVEADRLGIPPFRLSESVAVLLQIRRRTLNEIKGVFSPSEWLLMADSLNGTGITSEFRCLPVALAANVEDSDKFDDLGVKWGVDIPQLLDKINRLTAAQVDAVFTRIEAFWNDENRDMDSWSQW